jgi:ferredoxin
MDVEIGNVAASSPKAEGTVASTVVSNVSWCEALGWVINLSSSISSEVAMDNTHGILREYIILYIMYYKILCVNVHILHSQPKKFNTVCCLHFDIYECLCMYRVSSIQYFNDDLFTHSCYCMNTNNIYGGPCRVCHAVCTFSILASVVSSAGLLSQTVFCGFVSTSTALLVSSLVALLLRIAVAIAYIYAICTIDQFGGNKEVLIKLYYFGFGFNSLWALVSLYAFTNARVQSVSDGGVKLAALIPMIIGLLSGTIVGEEAEKVKYLLCGLCGYLLPFILFVCGIAAGASGGVPGCVVGLVLAVFLALNVSKTIPSQNMFACMYMCTSNKDTLQRDNVFMMLLTSDGPVIELMRLGFLFVLFLIITIITIAAA